MTIKETVEKRAETFFHEHLRQMDAVGEGRSYPELLADFAAQENKDLLARLERQQKALEHYADVRNWIADNQCWNGICVYHPIDKPDGTSGFVIAQNAVTDEGQTEQPTEGEG